MALTAIAVEDKTTGGPPKASYKLELPASKITVRELIRIYVADQVSKLERRELPSNGPNFAAPEEKVLNPHREPREARRMDCEAQFEKAVSAFRANQFFVIVDGRQVQELDAELSVTPDTKVSFLKLVPLVGG